MRGFRGNREFAVECQYASINNRAKITSEDPAGSGGGGSGLVQRGSDACRSKAGSIGYQSVNVTNAQQSSSNVTVLMTARNQNRQWHLTCIYRQSQGGTATIVEQSEAAPAAVAGTATSTAMRRWRARARRGHRATRSSAPARPRCSPGESSTTSIFGRAGCSTAMPTASTSRRTAQPR